MTRGYRQTGDKTRYPRAFVSALGTTIIDLKNPLAVAWWSAALPGFGHLLLSKYIRGLLLFAWEIIININAHLNLAMVQTFQGHFQESANTLDTRWIILYIPVYLFAIWDSYRSAVDLNRYYFLASREDAPFQSQRLAGLEINYLDQRTPWNAVLWSALMPGIGQLYIHRIIYAFYLLTWTIVIVYESKLALGLHYLVSGDLHHSTAVLNKEWLLFLPSIYFFSIYDAYVNTVENNKLFNVSQIHHLLSRYHNPSFPMPFKSLIKDR